MHEILTLLETAGMQVNADNCSFCAIELELINYLVIEPLVIKFESSLKMGPLKTIASHVHSINPLHKEPHTM